ncbi:MAG: hypothetical protein ACKOXO_07925 [Cyanobium sp.]
MGSASGPGPGPWNASSDDHRLGQQIAALIVASGGRTFHAATVLNQVQDLLGSDTGLIGPLWDLLRRPGFRALFAVGQSPAAQRGRRDALVAELAGTYNTAVLSRLAWVIDGCLGLPPGSVPSSAGGASAWPPYAPSTPSAPAPAANGGGQVLTAVLVAVVSLLAGAVLVGLAGLVMLNRPPATSSSGPSGSTGTAPTGSAAPAQTPSPPPPAAPSPPPPAATPKAPVTITPSQGSATAWGGSDAYKFGTVPGNDYPNSCAFSVTDANGGSTIDKSKIEYWACRDVGGNPETGYAVVWADGKQTNYTFSRDGNGTVVGTNGTSFPMRWRNDTHQGSNIIVINHEDGATTWIPGHVQ